MNGAVWGVLILASLVAQSCLAGMSTAEEFSTGFAGQLFHRDYLSSSTSSTTQTLAQRVRAAVTRSYARQKQISRSIKAPKGLKSPVSADNGEYLMEISLGTPPQNFTGIVDTGSDLVWVQCLPCKTCYNQTEPYFNPKRSKTYKKTSCTNGLCQALPSVACSKKKTCDYVYLYGDFSYTQGDFSYETVTMSTTKGGQSHIPKIAFGCSHNQQGNFLGAGGLVDLGKGPVSLPSQLASINFASKFSYCLVNFETATNATSQLILGDTVATNVSGIAYTPLLANPVNPTFYYVGVNGISIDGKLLNINQSSFQINSDGSGGNILDSGTTLTFLAQDAYDIVLKTFVSANTYPVISNSLGLYSLDLCVNVSGVSNPKFPDLVMHFPGVDYFAPPENTWFAVDVDVLCLAMSSGFTFSIIGNIQQQDHLIVYDNVKEQVGFKAGLGMPKLWPNRLYLI